MSNEKGLTREQVIDQKKKNLINKMPSSYSRSAFKIVWDNIFSYFNIIMTLIFCALIFTKNYANTLFIGVVVSNAFMGIFQELKTKKIVDALSVVKIFEIDVLRDGVWEAIKSSEIVQGDVLKIKAGNQVPVDGDIIESDGLEVDESLLTGESDPIEKGSGDGVLSGSFVTSGSGVVRAVRVGKSCYAGSISAQSKQARRAYSPLMASIEKIIKVMSVIILPVGVALFCSQMFFKHAPFGDAVLSTAGAIIGMIPSGLVLLCTVTMGIGVMRCAKSGALLSRQKAIESLARVDVVCIDKTGTITTGELVLEKVDVLKKDYDAEILALSIVKAFEEKNATAKAIETNFEAYLKDKTLYKPIKKIPFSSTRKCSVVEFENLGEFAFGAPEVLLEGDELKRCENEAKIGARVLALVKFDSENTKNGEAIALFCFKDILRGGAAEILNRFKKSGVEIKIISGDSSVAAAAIAKRTGAFGGAKSIDLKEDENFSDSEIKRIAGEYNVFGRVTPKGKKRLVCALKDAGKTVAMVGDGVNDVPAMSASHCAVALATGADAPRGVADVVLKNGFLAMEEVICEGRRVINNMGRVSVLYLIKTVFSLILSVFFMIFGTSYPLKPIYLTLIGGVFTGMPSFFMGLEKNLSKIKKSFTREVIFGSLPGAICVSLSIIALYFLNKAGVISPSDFELMSVWATGVISAISLFCVSLPLNRYRFVICTVMSVIFLASMFIFRPVVGLNPLTGNAVVILIFVLLIGAVAFFLLKKFFDNVKIVDFNKKN